MSYQPPRDVAGETDAIAIHDQAVAGARDALRHARGFILFTLEPDGHMAARTSVCGAEDDVLLFHVDALRTLTMDVAALGEMIG